MARFTRYLGLLGETLQDLSGWNIGFLLLLVIAAAAAPFLGFGTMGTAIVLLVILAAFQVMTGLRLVGPDPALEIEALPAAVQPIRVTELGFHEVFLVHCVVRNRGPTGDFVTRVVANSVKGTGEEYPPAGFPLRWQGPNQDEYQTIARGMDAAIEIAWVVPAARRAMFLGPGALNWRNVFPQNEEISGLIDISDVDRDLRPQRFQFRIITGPTRPVALQLTPIDLRRSQMGYPPLPA